MTNPEATILGIDLGTTNSEVAVIREGIPQVLKLGESAIIPSCVGVGEDGKIFVGQMARNQALVAPERTVLSVKRTMGTDIKLQLGDQKYLPQEISALILRELKSVAERALGFKVGRAVITVPAYFTEGQRQATRDAGQIAGLEVVRIVNEPTAAALGYEGAQSDQKLILVYDLGGGTFDVSILRSEEGVVEVLATSGDNSLGGDDFDEAIVRRLYDHIESEMGLRGLRDDRRVQARLLRAAESAKIALSESPYVRIEEDHLAVIEGKPHHLSMELSRADFESSIEEMLDRTISLVSAALVDAEVKPSQLDKILLVGGSTRIPKVAEILRQRLGTEPHSEIDPDLCVALGAAVQAGMESGVQMDTVLVDLTPYTFGTEVLSERYWGARMEYLPVIRKNTKLPAEKTVAVFTITRDQEAVNFRIFQGESPIPSDNVLIGAFRLQGLNAKKGYYDKGMVLTFDLDLDGLLKISATERGSGRSIEGEITGALGRMDESVIEDSKRRLEDLWDETEEEFSDLEDTDDDDEDKEDKLDKEVIEIALELIDTARDSLAEMDMKDEARDDLVDLMEDLHLAVESMDEAKVNRLKEELEDLLFFIG